MIASLLNTGSLLTTDTFHTFVCDVLIHILILIHTLHHSSSMLLVSFSRHSNASQDILDSICTLWWWYEMMKKCEIDRLEIVIHHQLGMMISILVHRMKRCNYKLYSQIFAFFLQSFSANFIILSDPSSSSSSSSWVSLRYSIMPHQHRQYIYYMNNVNS